MSNWNAKYYSFIAALSDFAGNPADDQTMINVANSLIALTNNDHPVGRLYVQWYMPGVGILFHLFNHWIPNDFHRIKSIRFHLKTDEDEITSGVFTVNKSFCIKLTPIDDYLYLGFTEITDESVNRDDDLQYIKIDHPDEK